MLMLVACTFVATAQKTTKDAPKETTGSSSNSNQQLYDINKSIYRNALKYNDLGTATQAVYTMLAVAPNELNLKDTLAYLYYNNGQYVQALLIGLEIVEKSDTNKNILEIVAISQQNLGLLKESLENYEKLYKQSKNIYHQYKVATLQYALKRYGECGVTIDKILQDKGNTEMITITDANRQQQEVSIKAAVLNMNGVMALELNQNDLAKKSFEEALKVQPDFALAKNNLDMASKPQQTQNQSTTTPVTNKK